MAGITVLQSDNFNQGHMSHWWRGKFLMKCRGKLFRRYIKPSEIADLKIAQQGTANVGAAIGYGIAGELLLGPLGMVAGAVLGGRNSKVVFAVSFKDGRKFVGCTSKRVLAKIQNAMFIEQHA